MRTVLLLMTGSSFFFGSLEFCALALADQTAVQPASKKTLIVAIRMIRSLGAGLVWLSVAIDRDTCARAMLMQRHAFTIAIPRLIGRFSTSDAITPPVRVRKGGPMYGDQQPTTPRRSRAFRKEATRERLATDGRETVSIETLRFVEPLDLEAEHWLCKKLQLARM